MFESLNVSLLASETISRAMNAAANATDLAGDQAIESGAQFGSLGNALDEIDDEAIEMAVGMRTAKGQIDEMGDEAMEAAVQTEALDAALDDVSRSSLGLGATLGPLRGSIRTLGPAAAAVTPALFGLGSALGGLGAAGGTAAAGLGAIAFGGLQKKAEDMAAASEQYKNSSEAMQAIFKNFGKELKQATEPLQTAANQEFAMEGLEGLVELVNIASQGFAQMSGTLRQIGSEFGGAVLETAPAAFDEMNVALNQMMPTFEALAGVIRDIPQLISFLTEQASQLQAELISFGGSAVTAAAGLSAFGTSMMEVVLPPLSVLLDVVGWAASALGELPKPLFAAAGAAAVAAAAYTVYTGSAIAATTATGALIAAIGILTAPISGTAAAIGALVGAVAGIISYFGWWDDIIGTLVAGWNGLVSVIEFGIEVTYGMFQAMRDLFGPVTFLMNPLGTLIWVFANLGEIIKFVGGVFDWFMGIVDTVISTVMGWIDTAVSAIQDLIGWATSVVNAIPGVNVDFGNIKETIDLGGLKAPEETEREPEFQDKGKTKEETKNVYDFSGADFSGTSQSQVEQTVVEAISKANDKRRAREDAQQF